MVEVKKSVTILRTPDEVYAYWRDLEHLPQFMYHLESVTAGPGTRSHWVAKAPAGTTVEWDAEITADQPGQLLAWRSLDGATVPNAGVVTFVAAPAGRGTELSVQLQYDPPGGAAGAAVARLFGEEPAQQLRDDLRRFKQVMETGEVVLSDGSREGAGQGVLLQRPAQPLGVEETS